MVNFICDTPRTPCKDTYAQKSTYCKLFLRDFLCHPNHFVLASANNRNVGRFPFNKNAGLKFRKFILYIPVAQTPPKPPRAWLLFLQAGYKRAVLLYWGQQFCQMERNISVQPTEMTRPVKEDHLQSWSRIWSVPFDVATEMTGILG